MKRALLVGINYTGVRGAPQLNGRINDIDNINSFLSNKCNYKDIRVLTDNTQMKPTKQNIQDSFAWLLNGHSAGDTLFFYYSGHGASVQDFNSDESDGLDSCLVPLDYQTNSVILDDWLFENVAQKVVSGAKLYCFTDCCHSGTMFDLKYNFTCKSQCKTTNPSSYNSSDWSDVFALSMENSKEISGSVCLFSGCLDAETSADTYINCRSQGAFLFHSIHFRR
ncbi:peptidase C14, caspase domain-containing protein [Zopfochytrium polystomum]|nr:peptidase C14, caspase domain-containing protein [Zopfochytrium polystomum]